MSGIERGRPELMSDLGAISEPSVNQHGAGAVAHRKQQRQRIAWAWSTSLLSKIATIAVQLLAVPLVYRALGEGGYAAFAAVTAFSNLFVVLNLGIGGSLVTPIAEAAARQDERRQAVLVQAGLGPLVLLCLLGSAVVFPIVAFLPLGALFGRVGATDSWDLRVAALIAASSTLAIIPLSAVTYLRQAYQEMHISNLIGAASNVLLCILLWGAAKQSTVLAVFVAIFVLVALGANTLNFGWLLVQRPFLLRREGTRTWEDSRHIFADGIRFLGAASSGVLVFQWPVYWIARTLPASTGSAFAICIQATILPFGFVVGFLQPLWSSTAEALARADHRWLDRQMRRARVAIGAVGGIAFLTMLIWGERLVHLWLRKPVTLNWPVRGLMGAYIMLAIWEQFYFFMALGFGRLREASAAQFQRSLAFAMAVPLLTRVGGVNAVWCGMCLSILAWTSWRLPRLLHTQEVVRNS